MDPLVAKYSVPAPRYTSYPTVPYWDKNTPDTRQWKYAVAEAAKQGDLSLYIHLPFCESLCTYCGCNTRITKNHAVEQPYINGLLKEWDSYRELLPGIPALSDLHLGGGTPTFFSPRNLDRLISRVLEGCTVPFGAAFSVEGHPVNTTREHLEILYDHQFRRLSLGIQDFDPRVQQIINRVQSAGQVEAVTRHAREIGYTSVNYDLVYGLPLQTKQGLEDTIRTTIALRPDRIAFYSYAHVPWMKPGQRRFTEADLPSTELKQELQELGRALFVAAGYIEIGMDHFALPEDSLAKAQALSRLHRNFMGYTDQPSSLLIGLGVSAVSDTGTAFAQNEKVVEQYLNQANQHTLPLFKLHCLTPEDLIIRRHIKELMCKEQTSWDLADSREQSLFNQAIRRLQPLIADGLVILSPGQLNVTGKGKRYLRNICMMLDERLWADKERGARFSVAG